MARLNGYLYRINAAQTIPVVVESVESVNAVPPCFDHLHVGVVSPLNLIRTHKVLNINDQRIWEKIWTWRSVPLPSWSSIRPIYDEIKSHPNPWRKSGQIILTSKDALVYRSIIQILSFGHLPAEEACGYSPMHVFCVTLSH